jgi:aryl-alcohol dehydrogenase-like predicted oxidoreductase
MQLRELGRSGLRIAPLMLGGNVFGWTADKARSCTLLDAFVDAGFNAIDTADTYSRWAPGNQGGESETIIGDWLAQRGGRAKVVIATKVGMDMGGGKKGLAKAYVMQAAEASLRRLRTDYIDLYQSHTDDTDTPIDETLEAYQALIAQGKVRAIGASNFSAGRLEEALQRAAARGLPRYESLQPMYNLCERAKFEGPLEELCLRHKVGVVSYFSLASGFLTGKYRSESDMTKSVRGSGIAAYLNERGQRILHALDSVAAARGATVAQIALAWLIARPSVTAPIASATSIAQLNELMGAARLRLEPGDIAELDRASAVAVAVPT